MHEASDMNTVSASALAPDPASLRRVCGRFATGVAIIGARTAQNHAVGLTVNSFGSVSLEPPLIVWNLARRSPNADLFTVGAPFGVSILRAGHDDLARRFAQPLPDKFAGVAHWRCPAGVPYLQEALATLSCAVVKAEPVGDHVLIVGSVREIAASEGDPLVFYGGAFTRLAA